MKEGLISVVMSVYKEPLEWLDLSIDSILNQTYSDIEFVIVNDNPTSIELKSYLENKAKLDVRIKLISNSTNIGLTKSLNVGLSFCRGEYIARMDADDISIPARLEKQLASLKDTEFDICCTNYWVIDEKGNAIKYDMPSFNIEKLTLTNTIIHPSVMFKHTVLSIRNPLYNEDFRRSQDYELWTYFLYKGLKFAYINEPLVKYRISSQQITRQNKGEQIADFRNIRRDFYYNYLHSLTQSVIDKSSPTEVLDIVNSLLSSYKGNRDILLYMRFVILFTLSKNSVKWALTYILNPKYYASVKEHRLHILRNLLGIKPSLLFLY